MFHYFAALISWDKGFLYVRNLDMQSFIEHFCKQSTSNVLLL